MDKLPGEGETKLIRRTRIRIECENCGEPATHKNTYLNDGAHGARRNPASSAYGKDNCSWCSDHDQFLCAECHASKHTVGVPAAFGWCATFEVGERFAHMFLRWHDEEIKDAIAA